MLDWGDDDSDVHGITGVTSSHEEVGDEGLSTAATLSWNYVQEDEGDGIDIEMPSRAPKLHRSFEAGRVKIKSLISCEIPRERCEDDEDWSVDWRHTAGGMLT